MLVQTWTITINSNFSLSQLSYHACANLLTLMFIVHICANLVTMFSKMSPHHACANVVTLSKTSHICVNQVTMFPILSSSHACANLDTFFTISQMYLHFCANLFTMFYIHVQKRSLFSPYFLTNRLVQTWTIKKNISNWFEIKKMLIIF